MTPEQTKENDTPDSEETRKSLKDAQGIIDLNKKIAAKEAKDPEAEEKKDEEKWRQEG